MSGSCRKVALFRGAQRQLYKHITLVSISLTIAGLLLFYLTRNKSCISNMESVNSAITTNGLDCGQAALMIIAQAHGEKTTGKFHTLLMENQCFKEKTVTSFYDLSNWSKAVGMKPLGLKIDLENLAELSMPAIVHTKYNHFLALMSVDDEQVVVIDRGISKYTISRRDFEDMLSGYVLCFR